MRQRKRFQVWCPAWIGVLLLAYLGASPPARADGPMFVIRMATGESAVYPVSDSLRIGFAGDTLVVAWNGGAETYRAETVTQIDFLMENEYSGIKAPKDAAALLKATHLFQNRPNPFTPETRITFDLPQSGPVELVIYSVNGRLIRWLVKDTREAGQHTASWDGRGDGGEKVGSGIYFYQLIAPGVEESRRMILLP